MTILILSYNVQIIFISRINGPNNEVINVIPFLANSNSTTSVLGIAWVLCIIASTGHESICSSNSIDVHKMHSTIAHRLTNS
jgi:hypothetical protein